MNDKTAHAKLKKINEERNKIGVGAYKNSRRDRNERHETFNESMTEMRKISDEQALKES